MNVEPGTNTDEPEPGRARPSLLVRALAALSAVLMFAMMAITFADVIGRYFLNSPITGAAEIISVLLGLMVFMAFPMVTRNESHITIGLFDGAFKGRVRRIQQIIVAVGSAAMIGLLASLVLEQALFMYEDGDVTYTLGIPKAPMMFAATALIVLAALLLLPRIWRRLIGYVLPRG